MKHLVTCLLGALASFVLTAAETVDLVSAKGTRATTWISYEAPADGTFTAKATLDGFQPKVLVATKEPRDPNAFFTDQPGFGKKVPVAVGLVDGAKGTTAKEKETVRVRVVVPVGATAPSGIFKGSLTIACGGQKVTRELWLKVLDFALPSIKTRYTGRSWLAQYGGALPANWTLETPDTYAKDSAKVTAIVSSMRNTKNDLQIERWRAFDVPCYGLLDVPYVVNPDAWRRQAGISAWQLGFDGVALPPDLKLDPIINAGLEDALIDLAYVSYAYELSKDLADRDRHIPKITYEGRMGLFWIHRINIWTDDLDVVRLELQARIVRLLAVAKKEVAK